MAALTWPTSWLCVAVAEAMLPMVWCTVCTASMMLRMVPPASWASCVPTSIFCSDAPIRLRISLAAVAERCARLRTSEATTAKPEPCSPARAASTAAFKAKMLV